MERYRVQYTVHEITGYEVRNAYFDQMTDALDFAAKMGRALVIDTLENTEIWYCPSH